MRFLNRHLGFAPGIDDLADMSRADLWAYQADRQADGLTPTSMARGLSALKSLYRGKNKLTLTQAPSAFMGEPTVDLTLRSRGEGLRATWSTQTWPHPKAALDSTESPRSLPRSTRGH